MDTVDVSLESANERFEVRSADEALDHLVDAIGAVHPSIDR